MLVQTIAADLPGASVTNVPPACIAPSHPPASRPVETLPWSVWFPIDTTF